jgi:DNA-binding NarL/FixJ family response regulator
MLGPHTKPTIVVVDAMELRRAGMISLLKPWADDGGLQLRSITPDEAINFFDEQSDCRMLIICFGGDSTLAPKNLRQIRVLRALAPDVPLVVVSDIPDPGEVAVALNSGAQGFVHTDTTPELTMQAFSFIMSGGSYFPSAAMRQLQGRSERGSNPALGQNRNAAFCADENRQLTANHRAHDRLDEADGRAFALPAQQTALLEHVSSSVCSTSIPAEVELVVAERLSPIAACPSSPKRCGTHAANGTAKELMRKTVVDFTPREKDVLGALELGLPNKLIAARLNVSENTVKMHIQRIMRKSSARNRTQALLLWSGRLSGI